MVVGGPAPVSTGTLAVSGAVLLNGSFVVQINGPALGSGYDQLNDVSGVVTIASGATLAVMLPSVVVDSAAPIVMINSSSPISGSFLNLPEGTTIQAPSGQNFSISYLGDQVTLNPVVAAVSIQASSAASAVPGTSTVITVVVSNAGSNNVNGVAVANLVPAGVKGMTYISTETGGATGATLSGASAINDTVNVPAGATITYSITDTISHLATTTLTETATATTPAGLPSLSADTGSNYTNTSTDARSR